MHGTTEGRAEDVHQCFPVVQEMEKDAVSLFIAFLCFERDLLPEMLSIDAANPTYRARDVALLSHLQMEAGSYASWYGSSGPGSGASTERTGDAASELVLRCASSCAMRTELA